MKRIHFIKLKYFWSAIITVVHHYGPSRNNFAYALDTFPVLKKKEKKAFDEFMSKQFLEEYNRIEVVLAAEGVHS